MNTYRSSINVVRFPSETRLSSAALQGPFLLGAKRHPSHLTVLLPVAAALRVIFKTSWGLLLLFLIIIIVVSKKLNPSVLACKLIYRLYVDL